MTIAAAVPSHIIEQCHESEIHVQLLVTVKEGTTRIVGDEVELERLKAAEHHHVLDHAGGGLAADTNKFKAMPMQVKRVDIVARVTELEPVAVPFLQLVKRPHGFHGEGFPVQRPKIEAVRRSVVLDDQQFDGLVGLRRSRISFGEPRIVPAKGFGF